MHKTFAALFFAALAGAFASTPAMAAPSAGEILDAYKTATGGSAWDDKVTLSADFTYAGQGMTGSGHAFTDLRNGRSESDFQIGPASGANGFDGTNPWQKDMSGTVTLQQGGDALALAVNNSYRISGKWWKPDRGGADIVNRGRKNNAGTEYDVLTITPKGGTPFDVWFDAETHFLVRMIEKQGPATIIATMSDYRSVDGVMLPTKIVQDAGNGPKYLRTMTLTKAKFLGPQPDSIYAPPKVSVTDFSIAGDAAQTTFAFRLINNHIYGKAKVDGKGPFLFAFDTGGHNIVTPPIAMELGLKIEGNLPTAGAGEGGFTHIDRLEIGNAVVKDQLFIVFPLDKLSDIEGIPLPGMVGYEIFRRFITRIDYGAKTITLIDPKHFDPKDAGTPIHFTFNDQIPEVMGTFEGLPAKFDIDTGARSELTLTKPFAEKNGLRASHPHGVDAVDGWGVGGPSTGYVTRGKTMTLGSVPIDNVIATLATQSKGAFAGNDYSGNVGGGILKRFIVTFDYGNQTMYLKPLLSPVTDTGAFDRAGMWINQSTHGFKIADVTRHSPAEEAGLKTNDTITAVDGASAIDIPLYDLRERLRNDQPGTVVTFTIKRGAKSKTVKVTLRDLI
ncbi:MAG: aspartyl protease family protein [Rhizomicrobium sp.]